MEQCSFCSALETHKLVSNAEENVSRRYRAALLTLLFFCRGQKGAERGLYPRRGRLSAQFLPGMRKEAGRDGGILTMEIIIRSRENGWETERRMELPEDAGLVKSILRSVKRRVDPPKLAGGGD